MSTNLVVGATGFLGGEICRRLVNRGKFVRALVRESADPSQLAQLTQIGATLTHGDLKDPTSLAAACQGIDTVITTATTTRTQQAGDSIEATDLAGQCNLVASAKAAGVRQFVYVSYSKNVDPEEPSPLTIAKRTVEQQVQKSGMEYTILRPGFFMEVWLSPILAFDYANAKATIYGTGHNPISWVSLGDVAEFAVQSIDHPAAANAILELGGPQALSPLEVVTIFEELGKRHFTLTHIPVEALQAQKSAASDPLQKSFASLMLSYAAGSPIPMEAMRKTFPISLTSVHHYAQRMLSAS